MGLPFASVNVSVPSSEMPHVSDTVVLVAVTGLTLDATRGCELPPPSLSRAYRPVPGNPVLRKVPRLPMPIDAPRGPSVQPAPDPLKFMRRPGASLMDFLNLNAISFFPLCVYARCPYHYTGRVPLRSSALLLCVIAHKRKNPGKLATLGPTTCGHPEKRVFISC
jgi:hypothetical protein